MKKLYQWFLLSRPAFLSVVILPFILGSLLAYRATGRFDWAIMLWGTVGAALIALASHYSGEYFDYETDNASARLGKNRFSGGSQVLQSGEIPRWHALAAAIVCLALAAGVGLLIQFRYKTGPLTMPLGILGIAGALFYSSKPIQFAYISLGEVWIGFCYGWLALAAPYYFQTGGFSTLAHLIAVPIAFTAFNVILINEFPDYLADRETGKRNLVVRFGMARMRVVYTIANLGVWVSFVPLLIAGLPLKALIFSAPIFLLSLITALQVLRHGYEEPDKLESICARTLVINLGFTTSLILSFLF